MEAWHFFFTRTAEDDLERLDWEVQRRVIEKLKWFVEHFDSIASIPLEEPWKGFFKLRAGDWRIVYRAEQKERRIVVHRIDRRDKIYRRRK